MPGEYVLAFHSFGECRSATARTVLQRASKGVMDTILRAGNSWPGQKQLHSFLFLAKGETEVVLCRGRRITSYASQQ